MNPMCFVSPNPPTWNTASGTRVAHQAVWGEAVFDGSQKAASGLLDGRAVGEEGGGCQAQAKEAERGREGKGGRTGA